MMEVPQQKIRETVERHPEIAAVLTGTRDGTTEDYVAILYRDVSAAARTG